MIENRLIFLLFTILIFCFYKKVVKILENRKILINIESCTKCKACFNECPHSCYSWETEQLGFAENADEECMECGHCVAICPVAIIKVKVNSVEDVKPIPTKEVVANYDSLLNLVQVRRSYRKFKKTPIPKELIEKILDLTRYTPTGHNEENIYYTVVQDPGLRDKFSQEITDQVKNFVKKFEDPEGRESLRKVLPADIMKIAESVIPAFYRKIKEIEAGLDVWHWDAEFIIIHAPKKAATPIENCSLAAMNIMLAAETLGLGTCSLGYATQMLNQFRTVSKLVKIPRNHKVAYCLSIGYPKVKYLRIPSRNKPKTTYF